MMKTYVKNKFEEILKNNEDTDIVPFNPLYEASQTPKINEKCLYTLRQAQSELYFKKEEYHANTTEKKSSRKLQKLNKKELSKYNTLEQKQLSLIQVLNDKIEFGHVFINSISQKQLVIRNKNEDKTILIELDLY